MSTRTDDITKLKVINVPATQSNMTYKSKYKNIGSDLACEHILSKIMTEK